MIDLSALNKEQYQAVTTLEGYIRVVASPGSGKTRALTYRYAYLVDHLGINPSNILCFTYTNKAADEMKGRICNLLDNEHYDFTYISTIHSYCWTFLRQYFKKHHMDGYWILDDSNFNIMVINMSDLSKLKLEDIKEFHNRVNAYKYNNLDYIRYLLDFTDDFKIPDVEIYKAITLQKRAHGLYFEDLVCATIYLLRKEHQLLMEEGGKFSYILVDEFQDTSPATYQIIKLLSSVNHNLFVVGDVDQSIFSFIGGDPEIFLHQFDEDFPHNITLYMNHNYRSTCEIIKACNQLIENNGNRFRDKHTVSATRRHGHYPITYTGKKDTLPEQALTIVKHLHDDLLQEYNSIFIIMRDVCL
jgi:DNA helicase-2/ATP-dependent DNA helicase PcrA